METTPESPSVVPKMNFTTGNSTFTPTKCVTSSYVNHTPPVPMNTESLKSEPSNCKSPVIMFTQLDENSRISDTVVTDWQSLTEETDTNRFHGSSASKKAKVHYENKVSIYIFFWLALPQ